MKISLNFDTFIHPSELEIADLVYKDREINAVQRNNGTYFL